MYPDRPQEEQGKHAAEAGLLGCRNGAKAVQAAKAKVEQHAAELGKKLHDLTVKADVKDTASPDSRYFARSSGLIGYFFAGRARAVQGHSATAE